MHFRTISQSLPQDAYFILSCFIMSMSCSLTSLALRIPGFEMGIMSMFLKQQRLYLLNEQNVDHTNHPGIHSFSTDYKHAKESNDRFRQQKIFLLLRQILLHVLLVCKRWLEHSSKKQYSRGYEINLGIQVWVLYKYLCCTPMFFSSKQHL